MREIEKIEIEREGFAVCQPSHAFDGGIWVRNLLASPPMTSSDVASEGELSNSF